MRVLELRFGGNDSSDSRLHDTVCCKLRKSSDTPCATVWNCVDDAMLTFVYDSNEIVLYFAVPHCDESRVYDVEIECTLRVENCGTIATARSSKFEIEDEGDEYGVTVPLGRWRWERCRFCDRARCACRWRRWWWPSSTHDVGYRPTGPLRLSIDIFDDYMVTPP